MKIDKDLAALVVLLFSYCSEFTSEEERPALRKMLQIFEQYGIKDEDNPLSLIGFNENNTLMEFVEYWDRAIGRIQLAIEEYEALERENY